jgi:hypothetical protein
VLLTGATTPAAMVFLSQIEGKKGRKKKGRKVAVVETALPTKGPEPGRSEEGTPGQPISDSDNDAFVQTVKKLYEEAGANWLVALDGMESAASSPERPMAHAEPSRVRGFGVSVLCSFLCLVDLHW